MLRVLEGRVLMILLVFFSSRTMPPEESSLMTLSSIC